MRVLVTGSAGFIGLHVTRRLLERGDTVLGIDNHNQYYDPKLKEARLALLEGHPRYSHLRHDISDAKGVRDAFLAFRPERVAHLAGQAGVRYSLENPEAYVSSNLVGFANVLEAVRLTRVEHFVYASSSSVYGANTSMPFSVHQNVDHPLSLYAASKKSNELMAHAYSHLFGIPTTGLRFFTVYGPWGRPDMAFFSFTRAILRGEPIRVYNHGHHRRDFTFVDDVADSTVRVLDRPATPAAGWDSNRPDPGTSNVPWRVYNIGSNRPVALLDYIEALENALGKSAIKEFLPLQAGDVMDTDADVKDLVADMGVRPTTPVDEGVRRFVSWYREYFGV